MVEEAGDDRGLFLSAVEVASGRCEESVDVGGSLREDTGLGVVVGVLGGVQLGAVAGQVGSLAEPRAGIDDVARRPAPGGGVAASGPTRRAPRSALDAAGRSALSAGTRCAGVRPAANGQSARQASSSFRAV